MCNLHTTTNGRQRSAFHPRHDRLLTAIIGTKRRDAGFGVMEIMGDIT